MGNHFWIVPGQGIIVYDCMSLQLNSCTLFGLGCIGGVSLIENCVVLLDYMIIVLQSTLFYQCFFWPRGSCHVS